MGGKFSDNPDPPCVHCGEDAQELCYLRERVAKLELDKRELEMRVEKLKTVAEENGALLLILQQQLSAEGIEPQTREIPSAYSWTEDGRWGVMTGKDKEVVYWCPDCGRQSTNWKHWPGCKRLKPVPW